MSEASLLPIDERELVVARHFAAPRELVFRAWTDPLRAARWWGPVTCPAESVEIDLRPGGAMRANLRTTAEQRELRHLGVFREVVVPERLVFTFAWDEPGERGQETEVTVTFAVSGEGTLVTLRQSPFSSLAARDGNTTGWSSVLDRFTIHLESTR